MSTEQKLEELQKAVRAFVEQSQIIQLSGPAWWIITVCLNKRPFLIHPDDGCSCCQGGENSLLCVKLFSLLLF